MPAEHIIKSYDEELARLNKMVVEMGGLAESQLADAIEAVVKRDSAARSDGKEPQRNRRNKRNRQSMRGRKPQIQCERGMSKSRQQKVRWQKLYLQTGH